MKDAWKQMDDLWRKFRKEWVVRNDLKVCADACDRSVTLVVGRQPAINGARSVHLSPRNVGTMREFATAILAACDFVDASNPKWASK